MNADLRETERFLHLQIPLSLAMGVRVEAYDGERLVLTAPIDVNHNHLGTAFGGSLSAVATLAGYSLLWLELRDERFHVVIRESGMSYRRPVRMMIRAVCRRPPQEEVARFKSALAEKGKARLKLEVTIQEDEEVAVRFTGVFVALR